MLYTRKGDKGDTGFFGSKKRISKGGTRPEALGTLDELNSFLGVVKTHEGAEFSVKDGGETLSSIIFFVQQNLFIIGSEIAGAEKTVSEEKVKKTEDLIARIEKEFPEIKTFRIPGGTHVSGLLDYARAISRRLERSVIRACEENNEVKVGEHSRQFLNRLSSLLYALARLANEKSGIKEESPTYE
jgi:cob(I)alamin adenosyltransferase